MIKITRKRYGIPFELHICFAEGVSAPFDRNVSAGLEFYKTHGGHSWGGPKPKGRTFYMSHRGKQTVGMLLMISLRSATYTSCFGIDIWRG